MKINLSADNPEIRWGNGKFVVDKDGILSATEAKISGKISASTITGSTISGGEIKIGGSEDEPYFYVNKYGHCNIRRGSITIGDNFSVNSSGTLVASNAKISGNITANSISSNAEISAS